MIKTYHIDRFILSLLSIILLVDVINGFLLFHNIHVSISQLFKSFILFLMLFRLTSNPKELVYILTFFVSLSIGPVLGFVKTTNITYLLKDLVVIIKWVNIVLSFFYFKVLIQSSYINKLIPLFRKIIKYSIIIIIINLFFGLLGFGEAFYNHGYGNASGTKGFFYAGNELSVLTLVLMSFTMFMSMKKSKKAFYFYSFLGILMSFVIGSKTIVLGLIIVFLYLYYNEKGYKLSLDKIRKTGRIIIVILPVFIMMLFYIINSTNMILKLKYSFRRNGNDILTTIMSNRNNFIKSGLNQYSEYNYLEKAFGIGQSYYVERANHIAEIDFFTLLFSNGFVNAFFHIVFIYFLYNQAQRFAKNNKYFYANFVKFMIVFLTIISNFAGHIYSSGVAGVFIGMLYASMYYQMDNKC